MNRRSIAVKRFGFIPFILFTMLATSLYPSGVARAASFTAGTYTELQTAINNANDETNYPGVDIISLTADIALTAALPQITSEVVIEGAAHSINGVSAFRVLSISSTGNLTINNLSIVNGYVSSADGAGIHNSGTLTINNSIFSDNRAVRVGSTGGNGGGIYTTSGTVVINHSMFSSNSAGTGGGSGGAIYMYLGSVTIDHSSFHGNTATTGGGIRNNGTLILTNSTISGNAATAYGGGILNSGGRTLTINNTTITGNSTGIASGGGGGVRNDGTLTLNRNIISGNVGPSNPTGVEVAKHLSFGTVTADNYNVLGHNGLTFAQAYSNFTPGTNDFDATSNNSNILLTNILTTTLATNGGPTLTHALVSGSPALDLAPSNACTASPINGIDQRGAARNYDGNGTPGEECDAGAVEYRAPTQNCSLSTGLDITIRSIVFNFSNLGDLYCLSVEEMGAPHLLGTTGIQTSGHWWHIQGTDLYGEIGSGYDANLTFPATYVPDTGDTVCRYTGSGWDCDADSMTSTSITRNNVSEFSDWAIEEDGDPTAVTLETFVARSSFSPVILILVFSLFVIGLFGIMGQVKNNKHAIR